MRVLMTGGFGCIGSWVAMQLIEGGHEVAILDLKRDTHRLDLLLDPEAIDRISFIQGDVTNPAEVLDAAGKTGATQLLHLAALQVPLCRADPIKGAMVNVVGTLAVFEAAKRR